MKQYTAEELSKLNKEDVIALLLQAQKQNALFMEQISVMQAQRFGRKTEKLETAGLLREARTACAAGGKRTGREAGTTCPAEEKRTDR